jgi:hypothetical protein
LRHPSSASGALLLHRGDDALDFVERDADALRLEAHLLRVVTAECVRGSPASFVGVPDDIGEALMLRFQSADGADVGDGKLLFGLRLAAAVAN